MNSLALSTEYTLRTGAFDHTRKQYSSPEEMKEVTIIGFFYCYASLSFSFVLRNFFFFFMTVLSNLLPFLVLVASNNMNLAEVI